MPKTVEESIGSKIVQKMIAMIAGGKYRQAMKAFGKDKKVQQNIKDMNQAYIDFKKAIDRSEKERNRKK